MQSLGGHAADGPNAAAAPSACNLIGGHMDRCLGYTSLASAGKRGLMGGVKILGESVDLKHACLAWSRKSHAWRGHKRALCSGLGAREKISPRTCTLLCVGSLDLSLPCLVPLFRKELCCGGRPTVTLTADAEARERPRVINLTVFFYHVVSPSGLRRDSWQPEPLQKPRCSSHGARTFRSANRM